MKMSQLKIIIKFMFSLMITVEILSVQIEAMVMPTNSFLSLVKKKLKRLACGTPKPSEEIIEHEFRRKIELKNELKMNISPLIENYYSLEDSNNHTFHDGAQDRQPLNTSLFDNSVDSNHHPETRKNPPSSFNNSKSHLVNSINKNNKSRSSVLKSNIGKNETQWPVTVPVYWHAIQTGGPGSPGNISSQQIEKTIQNLNNDFRQTRSFHFKLVHIEWKKNERWFKQKGPDQQSEVTMKRLLRKGKANTLNIYSADVGHLLGYSYFPHQYKEKTFLDGIVLNYDAIVNGGIANYDQGRVLTHEVGHWLGLFHTFENGCSLENDLIDDTRPQKEPGSTDDNCVIFQTTCGKSEFQENKSLLEFYYSFQDKYPHDANNNFMDYGPDECLNEFTSGQIERMRDQWKVHRMRS